MSEDRTAIADAEELRAAEAARDQGMLDEDDRLKPDFVSAVIDSVEAGNAE